MYTMIFDIQIGDYRVGMIDSVEVHKSVELLADTCKIVLPAAEYNRALDVESQLKRGDVAVVKFGYEETGLVEEFRGYLQTISTDDGDITLTLEDELYQLRKAIPDATLQKVSLENLLNKVVKDAGSDLKVESTFSWTYEKFVISKATAYDVIKKVQDECKADIYIKDNTLHVHAVGEQTGVERFYNFSKNVEECSLTYHKADDKRYQVVVKATMPDGTIKEMEVGNTGGDRIEIKCASADEKSMKLRAEMELKRRCFDGYEGSITTWLIPECVPGDMATLHDEDYDVKDGSYFVTAVTTKFASGGGSREIELGFRLS